MRVLVLGGMHGNELLGVELVRSLQESPIVVLMCVSQISGQLNGGFVLRRPI